MWYRMDGLRIAWHGRRMNMGRDGSMTKHEGIGNETCIGYEIRVMLFNHQSSVLSAATVTEESEAIATDDQVTVFFNYFIFRYI